MNRILKIAVLDVAPTLVVSGFAAGAVLFYRCRSHFHPVCIDLDRLLTGPRLDVIVASWLLLGFTAGMTMAMIVRLVFKPSQARWADRFLMVLGLLAVPGAGLIVAAGRGGGWELLVAILVTVLAAGVYGVWLLGFVINRAAFSEEVAESEPSLPDPEALHMEIRPAATSEADALSALAFEAKAHWGYSRDVLESWSGELGISASDVASKPIYVGAIEGEIAGFFSLAPSERAWELDNLWVAPKFMHRGVGSALLAHALEVAFRAGASAVTVDADPNAESFYLSCGATREGEVPAPIPGQPDRIRPQLRFRNAT